MQKQILMIISAIVLVISVVLLTRNTSSSSGNLFEIENGVIEAAGVADETEDVEVRVETEESEADLSEMIFVDVQGEVVNPGVFEVSRDVRIGYLIDLAGGLTDDAFVRGLNQAARVYDEMMIFVPHVDDVDEDEVVMVGVENSNESTGASQHDESDLLSLRTATAMELQSLPGIGPRLAENILAYREDSGPFLTIDELVNVDGIGAKTLENIREFIRP